MNQNNIIFAVSLLALALLVFGLSSFKPSVSTNAANFVNTGIPYHGQVTVYKNGVLIWTGHNTLVNNGRSIVQDLLHASGATAGVTSVALSNVTPMTGYSATDTTIGAGTDWASCGLSVAAGTYVATGTAGQWNVTKTFTNTCPTGMIVNATGLYNATSSGYLFAETNFTSTTLNQNDQINITWGLYIP
jgi:hypothetical protein